jgi:very-short-patch-repair endonuclease
MPIKRKIIPYNPDLKDLAKELRRNMTLSEVLLWNELKHKQMSGYDFDRQRPIGNFIVDFYCKDLFLAIEIDGDTHIYRNDYDEERQRVLEKLGVHFLKFEDIEVKKNMNNVLRVIEEWININEPTPGPSQEGNPVENDLNQGSKPTPGPSQEGNPVENDLNHGIKPTPGPSQEGNPEENNLNQGSKPTPGPSQEGNPVKNDLNQYSKPTPGPSQEGNPK